MEVQRSERRQLFSYRVRMALNKSPSMTHPSCTESCNRSVSSVDKLTLPPINRGTYVDRPKSQPLMPSRIPSLITKPDRSASLPNLDSQNSDTSRLPRVAQTRPWRPGSVSPQQIQSETRLPKPKLAKFLDRDWKSMSILPSYPTAGPERNNSTSGRSSRTTQFSVKCPNVTENSARSKIPLLLPRYDQNVHMTNEKRMDKVHLSEEIPILNPLEEKTAGEVSMKDNLVPSVRPSEVSVAEQNVDGENMKQVIDRPAARDRTHHYHPDSGNSTEVYNLKHQTETPCNTEFPSLSFLAKNVADGLKLMKDLKEQETGELTRPEIAEGCIFTESEGSCLNKTVKTTSSAEDLNNNKGGWHYYSTERAVKSLVCEDKPTCNKSVVEDTVTSDTDNTDTDHSKQTELENNVISEQHISNTTDSCSPVSALVNKSSTIELEDNHSGMTRTNNDGKAKTIEMADSPITAAPFEKKTKKKQTMKILRVDDKVDRKLLDCVAANPNSLSNNDAFELVNAIREEDNEAAKMIEELKLLTRLEKQQENKVIKSKEEEEQLMAEVDKYKEKLADTIDKKKKIDEKLMKIYKVELNPETEYAVIEDYLLTEKLAKTYHEKRNFEECSIAYLEHQLQTRIEPKNSKQVKKLREPKIKPRVTKNALRLQKDKGNKVRQEKIQEIEEHFKNRARHKINKEGKAKFFKEPSDNNYKPLLPEMREAPNKMEVDQNKSRRTDKPKIYRPVSMAKMEVRSKNAEANKANKLNKRKIPIKRNNCVEKDSQKSKQNFAVGKESSNTGSNSKEMKVKSGKGQVKSCKAYPEHDVKENKNIISKVDKRKYPMISGTSKTDIGKTPKSTDTLKIQNGQIRRQKIEPNRIKQLVHRSKDNVGSSKPIKLPTGKQTKTVTASNLTTTSNRKERMKLPSLQKPNNRNVTTEARK